MLRARHGVKLLREIWHYSATNRAWWLLPAVAALLAVAAIATASQAVVPYTIYTLF